MGASRAHAQAVAPWLEPDHWAARALVQLHTLGLTPRGYDPVAREHTSAEAAAAFAHAWLTATARVTAAGDDDARRQDAAVLRIVDGYVLRFAHDRPAAFGNALIARKRSYVHGEIAAGFASRADALLAGGFDLHRNWVQPRGVPDYNTIAVNIEAAALWRDRLALTLQGAREGGAGRIERLTIDAHAGPLVLWAGRRAPAYAPQLSGGLVQYGAVAMEGGGVRLARPLRLPLLGAITAETFVGRLGPNGHVSEPWLWGSRLHTQPHARLDVGLVRTAVFGGMRDAQIGLQQIGEITIGANLAGDYADDQVAAIDARWRPPLRLLPLELYGEWGAHDVDIDVLIDVPAFALGARMGALPFAPMVSAAIEHTQINRSCCENPPWYHHFELADGWTEDGVLIGHPLGGHGREWRAALSASLFDARLLADAQFFRRVRGDENLFADVRAGRAHGATFRLDIQPARHLAVRMAGTFESAASWSAHEFSVFVVFRP